MKLENILLDLKNDVKLIDFGFASVFKGADDIDENMIIAGTESFMAPEMLSGKQFQGDATDMFSLGCILFIMSTGRFPFKSAIKDD